MEKNPKNASGCAFGKITRERVDNFIKMFDDFRNNDFKSLAKKVDQDFKSLAKKVDQSEHRPTWAVSTIIWILSSLAVGLLVRTIILGIK